jgi:hypothetical protein
LPARHDELMNVAVDDIGISRKGAIQADADNHFNQ